MQYLLLFIYLIPHVLNIKKRNIKKNIKKPTGYALKPPVKLSIACTGNKGLQISI